MKRIPGLSIDSILAAPRNHIIYKVNYSSDQTSCYVMKVARSIEGYTSQAFFDEYINLRAVSHPVLPAYQGFFTDIQLSEDASPLPCVFMEYIEGIPLTSIPHLTTKQLKKYILDLGDALHALLEHGVLYMDLHPGNLLVQGDQIRLIDFTKAYYFKTNPNPNYTPKISYQINQLLPGQQILIQALTYLILNLPDHFPVSGIPSSLLDLGKNPHKGMSFSDFLTKLDYGWAVDE